MKISASFNEGNRTICACGYTLHDQSFGANHMTVDACYSDASLTDMDARERADEEEDGQ